MAEIKNNFLGAKMNQDIDDRLLPSNEYRYALNLQINRSENSDVGTLQNVLGNTKVFDVNAVIPGVIGLECIGLYADNSTNKIYIYLTNNSGTTYNKNASNFIYSYDSSNGVITKLVSGAFLNFSTLNPVLGINLIEELLFWTDNRNQPRRINVKEASSSETYYTFEKQISVAKINPLYPIELYRLSEDVVGEYETSMYDVSSELLPDGITDNPYYDDAYAGDPIYLEDKFIRFSYRYKFEDGEYSIMAPFTQIAYIPKQDGYFLEGDEDETYRSTVVKFMKNKVNNIFLQIKLPCAANLLTSECKISYIEILCKDSNKLTVEVIESVPVNPALNGEFNNSSTVYSYNYQSKKPFKTLPERDLIRVYDKTPIKALGQEVAGNRVIYSNYQDKSTYPKYLDYNVGYGTKYNFGFENGYGTSIKEYPNHSVKQNRSYQVGIILCDRFGRESGVILSNSTKQETAVTAFGGSSLYAPYLTEGDNTATRPSYWPGNSLKVLFNEAIYPEQPNSVSGWPGIYNGDTTSTLYNPLGWYSYKIVVKQTEQDYYNVYLAGTMASYPTDTTIEVGKTSHVVLINDNINKVPRDLTEVGPTQIQFRSSVVLYPRVNNNLETYKNEMYYPDTSFSIVSTIGNNNTLFFNNTVTLTETFDNFYQIDSDPLIARISTPSQLGVIPSTELPTNVINMSVFETKAVDSRLDIYWETSSVGLISELNYAIQNNSSSSVSHIRNFIFDLSEDAEPGAIASSEFYFEDVTNALVISPTVTLISAQTQNGIDVIDKFEITPVSGSNNRYVLRTRSGKYFYYGYNSQNLNNYIFNIRASVTESSGSFNVTGTLTNKPPFFTSELPEVINKDFSYEVEVWQYSGQNGSNVNGGNSTSDLTWSVTGSPQFTMSTTGVLTSVNDYAEGEYNLTVRMTEASGLFVESNIKVIYPNPNSVTFTGETSSTFTDFNYGTVTITGKPAAFFARSTIVSGGFLECSTNIFIDYNGLFLEKNSYRANTVGSTDSTPTIYVPAGEYVYQVSIEINQENGSALGSIGYLQ